MSKWHDVCVEPSDIVIGGPAHRQALETLLRTARSRVIIHSTFLREQPFRLLLPLMLDAVKGNVAIDILHGKDHGADDEASAAVQAVRQLRRDPDIMAYRERLRLHPESTRSHAKVIVADPYRRGQLVALVSSCNWLDTPFKRIEAGIYLRDPAIVREVLHCLMRLVAPGSGVSPQLATDLFRLGQALPPPDPARRPNGKAILVIGEAHNAHVLRARDTVRHDLLLTSHKLGKQFDAGALIPLARACERRRVRVRMIYSTLRGIDKEEESQFRRDAQANRIALTPERDPQVHAKLLAWDRNDAVITSQNWLSADPGYTPLATELGVAVQCPGVGSWVMDAFAQVLVAQRRRRPSWRGRRQQARPE